MKIIISDIPDDGLDVELNEALTLDAGSSPVQAHLKIKKIGTEVVVNGNILTDVELQCSRCLKDFRSSFSFPFESVFRPINQLKEEEKHELKVDELDMGFYSKDELDLLDIIKEQIMLNLPMKALCSDLCKGMCLQCGANLNVGDCGCITKGIDSRFNELKKLLK